MNYFCLAQEGDRDGRPLSNVVKLGLPCDSAGIQLNPSSFRSGREFPCSDKVALPIEFDGPAPDIIFAAFEILVAHQRVVAALEKLCPSEFRQIAVATTFSDNEYFIIDPTAVVPCLDKQRSTLLYEPDSARPDAGEQIACVLELAVDAVAIGGRHLVRPKEYDVVVIVSEVVKSVFEKLGVRGAEYWAATRDV